MLGEKAPVYTVPPCSAIVLNGKDYHASSPNADGATTPTVVHVAHGSDEYYRARWTASGSVSLSTATLETIHGSGPFSDFAPGESYIVAVGTESAATDKVSFAPMWVGKIQVQASTPWPTKY